MSQNKQTVIGAALERAGVNDPMPTTELAIIDGNKTSGDDLTIEAATNGLPIDKLFSRVIFQPVKRNTFEQRGRDNGVTGYSRKVADVLVELAGSGVVVRGSMSLTQRVGAKTAGLRFSWHWNNDAKSSCFGFLSDVTESAVTEWKDKTIEAFKTYAIENKIDLASTEEPERHVVAGVSIIG